MRPRGLGKLGVSKGRFGPVLQVFDHKRGNILWRMQVDESIKSAQSMEKSNC